MIVLVILGSNNDSVTDLNSDRGSGNGAVVRALASHRRGLGWILRPGVTCVWFEFSVGSRPCSEGFLRVLRFSSLHKNQHFQIPILNIAINSDSDSDSDIDSSNGKRRRRRRRARRRTNLA